MRLIDSPPCTSEIEEQLSRILLSPRFANAPNPSAFLDLVVRRTLAGEKITARTIGEVLFTGKMVDVDSDEVRVTAINLRKTIDKYYKNEGRQDTVIISMPTPSPDRSIRPKKGEAYSPTFRYNVMHPLVLALKLGDVCLEEGTVKSLKRAAKIFSIHGAAYPNSIGPIIGYVEALCGFVLGGYSQYVSNSLADGRMMLDRVAEAGSLYWRYWAVSGLLSLVSDNLVRAKEDFKHALSFSALKTEGYIGYISYLLVTGSTERGTGLVQRYLMERVEEPFVRTIVARLLMLVPDPPAAMLMLFDAVENNRGDCAAHQELAKMAIYMQDPDVLAEHMAVVKLFVDSASYEDTVIALRRMERVLNPNGTVVERALPQDADVIALPDTYLLRPEVDEPSAEHQYLRHVYEIGMGMAEGADTTNWSALHREMYIKRHKTDTDWDAQ